MSWHSGPCEVTRAGDGLPCECGFDAALKALEGGGDVRVWLAGVFQAGERCEREGRTGLGASPLLRQTEAVDAALASPPALPGAEEAMAAFARSVMDWTLSNTTVDDAIRSGQAADLARRWIEGEGR